MGLDILRKPDMVKDASVVDDSIEYFLKKREEKA